MAEKKKKPYEIGELDQYLFGQEMCIRDRMECVLGSYGETEHGRKE